MSRSIAVFALGLALAACKGGTAPSGTAAAAAPASSAPPASAPAQPGAPPAIDGKTPLPDPLPEVAATVNGQPVYTRHIKVVAEQALQSGSIPADQKAFAYRRVLQQFIVRELLLQEALARGLTADPKRLEQAENNARSRYQTAAQFQAALAQQGLDEASFKAELRSQVTADALVYQLSQETPHDSIPQAELKKFYESNAGEFIIRDRVRAAHILVRVPKGAAAPAKAALRTKVEGLLAEIRGGADFAALATKHSEDPASKGKGGEMEPFGRGQMPPELGALEEGIQGLKPGEVSNVIESPAGFHIAKLFERLPDQTVPFDAVEEQIRHHLLGQKRHEALQAFVNQLRAKAKIETHL